MKREDSISQGLMLLCLGTAALLLMVQWQSFASSQGPQANTTNTEAAIAPTRSNPPKMTPQTNTQLIVDLSDRQVSLYQQGQKRISYPVAIGQAGWETPTGQFRVEQMLVNPSWKHPITGATIPAGPDSPLGARWIGFWQDGHTQIGFHGTNQEQFIGQAVSHGCIRMRNTDIIALYAQVQPGTPVTVQP